MLTMRTAIRAMPRHFRELVAHFQALETRERMLRFGLPMSELQINAYVRSLLAAEDTVLVVVEPLLGISGVLHLESMGTGVTLGLSVLPRFRGRGIGTLLMQRAVWLARVRGLKTVFARSLDVNEPLQRLAVRAGMAVAGRKETPGAGSPAIGRAALAAASAPGVTLDDDSRRPRWNGVPQGGPLGTLAQLVGG